MHTSPLALNSGVLLLPQFSSRSFLNTEMTQGLRSRHPRKRSCWFNISARDEFVFFQSNTFSAPAPQDCLLPFWWKTLQQFLCSLIEPFLVFLLLFAGFKGMLGSTDPNELFCSRIIHAKDKCADVDR
jgi:hypothetical protein